MGGKSKSQTTSNTNYSNTTAPYAPAQQPLTDLTNTIANNQKTLPSYEGQAQDLAGNLLAGQPNYNQMAADTLSAYQGQLTPFTQASYLDPMSNPYLGPALQTMQGDITNQIKDQFAAAGRSGSGLENQNLARGLSQGLAQLLLGQYNTNASNYLGASKDLYNAGNATNQGILSNAMSGLQVGQQVPLLANNAGATESLLLPIAAAFPSNTGNQNTNSTTVNTPSPLQTATNWANLIGKVGSMAFPGYPGFGGFGKI